MEPGANQSPGQPGAGNPPQSTPNKANMYTPQLTPITFKPSAKGVENAKKRLRAFSIQKKSPLAQAVTPKPSGSTNTMVLIGKLSSVKVTPKSEEQDTKPKLPKPPKPGTVRKALQDSYTELQRRTLADIEDMKRKMELVDLGIPLGLICPTSTSEKAMPTKAMPPIKSFIDPAKVDELIREAKKAKLEGKEFKFDYQKLLPGYDNPFQNKKKEEEEKKASERRKNAELKEKRRSDKYTSSSKRYSDYRKDDKYKERDRGRVRDRDKTTEQKPESSKATAKPEKETDVNLNDYLVCDSWSLDNDEKTSSSSPKFDEKSDSQSSSQPEVKTYKEPSEILKASLAKKHEIIKQATIDKQSFKLKPVMDSFKYEIDDNEEEVLDIFDADSKLEKFAQVKTKKLSLYDSPDKKCIDLDDSSRDLSLDGMNDDTFLESVINEIKVGDISDDSQDKGLVEYDISPGKDDTPSTSKSVTPELSKKERKSDYSDGYRSSESGYKTSDTMESGYKSETEFRLSIEKELDDALNASKMSKATVKSLETWSFVLKICQPLLFRHDKNKCYRETRSEPKVWWTVNPRACTCVKDRSVVYEELEMCKMNLVDRVYGCDQIADEPFPKCRSWYPAQGGCLLESGKLQPSSEWEGEDSQQPEVSLDREYQRFMEAVWPDAMDGKKESSRSTTPVQENKKKRKEESEEKKEEDKKAKKVKLSSEGWSQESDVEEDEKSKKVKRKEVKARKRKHSTSLSSSPSDSEEDSRKKKKALKKKAMKKVKSKSAKRRRMGKKLLKKLKEKQKKNKKNKDLSEDESDSDKKEKRSKKKKLEKAKKKEKKRKKAKARSSSSESTTSSSSESDTESDERKKTKKKTHEKTRKKTKKSSSESQSEELFDVNILNNIKTEKVTDDEGTKLMEFSPRRQKPREIINVKELQNDFVGNNMIIKQEVEEQKERESNEREEEFKEPNESGDMRSEIEVMQDVEDNSPQEEKSPEVEVKEVELMEVQSESVQKKESMIQECDEEDTEELLQDYMCESEQEPEHKVPVNEEPKPIRSVEFQKPVDETSQESICSIKEVSYDKAEGAEGAAGDYDLSAHPYEMCEHLALAYQSDVASQAGAAGAACGGEGGGAGEGGVSRIETVVRARCGEITCDWRAGQPAPAPLRPSRWGLKPGEVNIVLTGGDAAYRIPSLAHPRDTNTPISYDEAYMDTYGAADRLQYGDCFSTPAPAPAPVPAASPQDPPAQPSAPPGGEQRSTLDDRINQALRDTVLGDVAKELEGAEAEKEQKEKAMRASKRVRFADGYEPGQDSDTEPPPKRARRRRTGCAWPCPAAHPDHVSLWDALPPPPPPPGSPPRRAPPPAPAAARLLHPPHPAHHALHPHPHRYDPLVGVSVGRFMPPEPPPGLIALH